MIFRGFIIESVSVTYCIQLGTGQGILLNDNVLNVWEISKLLSKKGMLLTHNAWQKVNNIQLSPEREVNRGGYLTIIPRARMGYESIAHEAEWAIDSEAMRARGIIVLVKSN